MATPSKRLFIPLTSKPDTGTGPGRKPSCWEKLRQKFSGKKGSQVQAANGEHSTNTGMTMLDHGGAKKSDTSYTGPAEKGNGILEVGDKQKDSKLPRTSGSFGQDASAETGSRPTPDHLQQNKPENGHGSPTGKSKVIPGAGDKKMDSKLPEVLGSSVQDDKTKTFGGLKPGPILPNKQENSYAGPAEKNKVSPGVGDKKMDSQLQQALGSLVQDAKLKTDSSHKPGHLLPNKQEYSSSSRTEREGGIPGVGDKMDLKLPEALESSDLDSKTKPVGSLKPALLLPNKQENSYAGPAEKIKGSPEVGGRKLDSKLPENLGTSDLDAKAKTGSSLKPGNLLPNKHDSSYASPAENSKGIPGVGEKKLDSKLLESLGSSDQDAKPKTDISLKPGQLLQNNQENRYGNHGVGDKKVVSRQPEALRNSDQDAKIKAATSVNPGNLLQNIQGNRSPEQLFRKSPPKEDVRQEDINEHKDPKPKKETISGFQHPSEEQQKPGLQPEHNSESKTNKFNGSPEQGGLLPRNDKRKETFKHPSFKNKDNIYIDTSPPKPTNSVLGYAIPEQQKGVKQENKNENQINTKPSSPVITNFSSLRQGEQFLSKEQPQSVVKSEGVNKNDKSAGPSYADTTMICQRRAQRAEREP